MLPTAIRWLSTHAPREMATARALLQCTERTSEYVLVCACMDAERRRRQLQGGNPGWQAVCDQSELLRESWWVPMTLALHEERGHPTMSASIDDEQHVAYVFATRAPCLHSVPIRRDNTGKGLPG